MKGWISKRMPVNGSSLSRMFGIGLFFLSACGREPADRPEIQREIELMRNKGWEFVEMVGEARSTPDVREIRHCDESGALTVRAMNSGANGNDYERFTETFKEEGFEFLEVKIMTSPADGYSLVFRKRRAGASLPD